MKQNYSRAELLEYANSCQAFYGIDLNFISSILIDQIMQLELNRVANIFAITDEIKRLEGFKPRGNTKPAERFKRDPLKGLYKKHFFNAQFLAKNLEAYFGMAHGGNKRLDHLISEFISVSEPQNLDKQLLKLAHEATIGAYEKRAQSSCITGEWIVFQKYQGSNYYLTVAAHDEGDPKIYERVQMCYDLDFNFLAQST